MDQVVKEEAQLPYSGGLLQLYVVSITREGRMNHRQLGAVSMPFVPDCRGKEEAESESKALFSI